MLSNISVKEYRTHFILDSNPYISEPFLDLVKDKCDEIIHLMDYTDKSIGIVAGIKHNFLESPFSAPFGGFHYSHEHLMYTTAYEFINKIKHYIENKNLSGINIKLPPDIYQTNMNAKLVSAMIRSGYKMNTPNIINWINLKSFDGNWVHNKVSNRCRKAIKNELIFQVADNLNAKKDTYKLIEQNRVGQGREIHMTFDDLMKVSHKIPVDFLQVNEPNGSIVGAGILYRGHNKIIQAIFMGDDLNKRSLGAIDYLYLNIYNHYKNMDYEYIDFGTSSLDGEPNAGLLRFKEIHNCSSALQYSFTWTINDL